jgi:multiple sugar transport system permease protein
MACATVVTLPIIVLFFLTQRTFVQGIALTGLKN